jgi:hypothetical protein
MPIPSSGAISFTDITNEFGTEVQHLYQNIMVWMLVFQIVVR